MTLTAPALPADLLTQCRVLPDRVDILGHLPGDIVFAEVGVALGDFTRQVLDRCRVRQVYAIDIFTMHHYPQTWGGRVGEVLGGLDHRSYFEDRFASEIGAGRVTVLEGDSVAMLEALPDRSLDVVYLDADHAYEAVRAELAVVSRKIAPGGIIILNDYTMFDQYRLVPYGVPRAAHEFMIENGWEAIFLALHPDMFCDLVIRKRGDRANLAPAEAFAALRTPPPTAALVEPARIAGVDAAPDTNVPHIVHRPDPRCGDRAREVLRLLRPLDVANGRLLRKGRPNDGGYVMLDHALSDNVAYSLGISDDVSWDLDMAALGCSVFQYDYSVPAPPVAHPRFHFEPIGIAARPSPDGRFHTLDALIDRNGHGSRSGLILKIDIEAAEWDVFGALPVGTLQQFSQILVEMHRFTQIDDDAHYARVRHVLHRLNQHFQCVHVHANNYGWLGLLGGVMLPDTLEVTYVLRAAHRFLPCRRVFPTEIDMPCDPKAADFFLGALGQVGPAA